MTRRVLSSILERAHYDVMASTDGHEAWTELAAARIDLVITDREMPAMNGLELLRAVRQSPRHGGVPVIMLTGTTLESAGDEADAEGASAFLTKPVSSRELLEIVERLLRDTTARPASAVAAPRSRSRRLPAGALRAERSPASAAARPTRRACASAASSASDGALVATWRPGPHHEAFPGVLNGGIIGTLLDCHCNWAAAHALMRGRRAIVRRAPSPRSTRSACGGRRRRRPRSTCGHGWSTIQDDRATIDGELSRRRRGHRHLPRPFVAVKPGHPAYHRW